MLSLGKIFLISFVFGAFIILQSGRFISFGNISPNFILVFSLFMIFLLGKGGKEEKFVLFLIFIEALALYFLWFNFWPLPMVILFALIVFFFVVKNFLTAFPELNFILSIFLLTSIFYVLMSLFNSTPFVFSAVFWESIVNVLLGVSLWLVFSGSKERFL